MLQCLSSDCKEKSDVHRGRKKIEVHPFGSCPLPSLLSCLWHVCGGGAGDICDSMVGDDDGIFCEYRINSVLSIILKSRKRSFFFYKVKTNLAESNSCFSVNRL